MHRFDLKGVTVVVAMTLGPVTATAAATAAAAAAATAAAAASAVNVRYRIRRLRRRSGNKRAPCSLAAATSTRARAFHLRKRRWTRWPAHITVCRLCLRGRPRPFSLPCSLRFSLSYSPWRTRPLASAGRQSPPGLPFPLTYRWVGRELRRDRPRSFPYSNVSLSLATHVVQR